MFRFARTAGLFQGKVVSLLWFSLPCWPINSLLFYQLFGAFKVFLIFYLSLLVAFTGIVGPNNSACHNQASNLSCNQITSTQNTSPLHMSSIYTPLSPSSSDNEWKKKKGNCQQKWPPSSEDNKSGNLVIATMRVRFRGGPASLGWRASIHGTLKHHYDWNKKGISLTRCLLENHSICIKGKLFW